MCGTEQQHVHFVRRIEVDGGRRSRDEDRDNWDGMASFVKVLQIESIIPNLLDSSSVELTIAYLELHDENYRADDENRINPPAHARDAELHEN